MEENQKEKILKLQEQSFCMNKQKNKIEKINSKNLPKPIPQLDSTKKTYLNPTRRIKKISNIKLDPISIINSKLFNSFNQMLFKGSRKMKWSPKEDSLLRKGIGIFGARKWKKIAGIVGTRSGKQCRERWYNHVRPFLVKKKWTDFEDWLLFLNQRIYGNKWIQISKVMDGKSDNDIKNRWNTAIKKNYNFLQEKLKRIGEIFVKDFKSFEKKYLEQEKKILREIFKMGNVFVEIKKKERSLNKGSNYYNKFLLKFTKQNNVNSIQEYINNFSLSNLSNDILIKNAKNVTSKLKFFESSENIDQLIRLVSTDQFSFKGLNMISNQLDDFYKMKIKKNSTIQNKYKIIFEKKIINLNSFDEKIFVLDNLFQIQRNSFKDLYKKNNLPLINEISEKEIVKSEKSLFELFPIKEEIKKNNFKFKKIQLTNENYKRKINLKHIQNVTLKNDYYLQNTILKKYCFTKVKKNNLHNSEDVQRYILKKFPHFTFNIDGPIENSSVNSEQVLKQRQYELIYRLEKIGFVYPFVYK